jgi:TRAP-type C4-dicarboxylate transport system substrate-binding protein
MKMKRRMPVFQASLFFTFILLASLFASISYAQSQPAAKPITLKFGTWQAGGTKNPLTTGQYWYLDELEKRTNGRLKIQRYDAESLAPGPALLDALKTGMADIAGICPPYFPAELPLHQVTVLPGFSVYPFPRAMAFYDLYQRVPEMKAELTGHGVKLISIQSLKSMGIVSKSPIRTLADLKGKKLRILGYQAQLLAALGGVPVSMPTGEIYDAISRGTIDGHIHDASAVIAFGTYSVCKYFTELNFGNAVFLMAMKQSVFDSLPADIKKLIDSFIVEGIKGSVAVNARDNKACEDMMRGHKIEFIKPRAEDEAVVDAKTDEIIAKWVAQREAEKRPAQKVVTELKQFIKQYKPDSAWFPENK